MNDFLTVLSALAALIFVLGLSYFSLKWMNRKMVLQPGSRFIKILDRVMVGQDKCLLLVRTGEKVFLVGMANNAVENIGTFDAAEFPVETTGGDTDFSGFLRDALAKGISGFSKKEADSND